MRYLLALAAVFFCVIIPIISWKLAGKFTGETKKQKKEAVEVAPKPKRRARSGRAPAKKSNSPKKGS